MAKPKGTGFVACTNCGGTGAVDSQEIIKDKNGNYVTVTVRKICSRCKGKGGFHV